MLIQTFQMGVVEANFFINQHEIAENLCENKGDPGLHCNGHCQLKKELEKHGERSALQLTRETGVFIAISKIYIASPVAQPDIFSKPSLVSICPASYVSEIFHPPGQFFAS